MSKKPISDENKKVARHAAAAFGGKPHVQEYLHDSEPLKIDMLWCDDRPVGGVTAYSTVGLWEYPMKGKNGDFPTRLEIAGACETTHSDFPNVLATAAFIIMRTHRLIAPGSVIENCVSEYFKSGMLPHLYFTAPFLWEPSLKTLALSSHQVSWLLAMPISTAELQFLRENGDGKLEDLFESADINVYDLARSSVA